jgi:hypothetical protein
MRVGLTLDRLSRPINDPDFMPIDRLAAGWYAAILILFVLAVAAGLHGSSMSLHAPATARDPAGVRPIVGTPKPIRSDEWAYHTPAILQQVYRSTPMDGEVSALGPDYTSLISNIPVRHFTTVFRPQFWGFFVLPPAYAFAFYWQFKALLLTIGVFSLLLLLTRSSPIAAFGTLWYTLSPFVQWTYSWPSLLPEMIGLFCLVMCAVFYMSVGKRPALLLAAAVACVFGAVNFALCAYIPHQIPLVWLGVFLCIWWMSARWKAIFTRDGALLRSAYLGGAWLVVGLVMFGFYRDAEPALTTMANTVYPGLRSFTSGAYHVTALFSHFFSPWADDGRYPLPHIFGNICECAGFFWLAPVSFFLLRGTTEDAERKRAFWILAAFGALLFIWMTLPLPDAIGRATFMNKSGAVRCLHVLGLVNVALVGIALSLRGSQVVEKRPTRQSLVLAIAVLASVYPIFRLINVSLANFLTNGELFVAACYTTVLSVTLVENRFALLAAFLIVPHAALFGHVNPIDRGLRVFESAPLFRVIQGSPDLLRHRWIVYTESVAATGFFSAVGCEIVNGLKYVPDLKTLGVFDPTGAQHNLINRSMWLLAEPEYGDRPAGFEPLPPNLVKWRVSPLDPALRRVGVRYAAFTTRPPPHVAASLRPILTVSVSGFWLYELP